MTLVEFLTAMLDRDEAVARGAIDAERPGTHWQWVTDDDVPVEPGGLAGTRGDYHVSLRTVEEFQTQFVGPLPAFLVTADDVHPGAGDHIALHDPARVLAAVDAARARLHLYDAVEMTDPTTAAMLRKIEALPYVDDPDYDESWRP